MLYQFLLAVALFGATSAPSTPSTGSACPILEIAASTTGTYARDAEQEVRFVTFRGEAIAVKAMDGEKRLLAGCRGGVCLQYGSWLSDPTLGKIFVGDLGGERYSAVESTDARYLVVSGTSSVAVADRVDRSMETKHMKPSISMCAAGLEWGLCATTTGGVHGFRLDGNPREWSVFFPDVVRRIFVIAQVAVVWWGRTVTGLSVDSGRVLWSRSSVDALAVSNTDHLLGIVGSDLVAWSISTGGELSSRPIHDSRAGELPTAISTPSAYSLAVAGGRAWVVTPLSSGIRVSWFDPLAPTGQHRSFVVGRGAAIGGARILPTNPPILISAGVVDTSLHALKQDGRIFWSRRLPSLPRQTEVINERVLAFLSLEGELWIMAAPDGQVLAVRCTDFGAEGYPD